MASFGINLDLQLRGESGLQRAIRGAEQLEALFNKISDKGLDLSKIKGIKKTGDIADFKKKFTDLAQEIAAGKKKLGDTEVSIRRFRDAFVTLAANTKAGTPSFNEFTAAITKLDTELDKIAHASENARRAQLGLLSVEEEAAETARRTAEAKEAEAKARRENEEAIEKEQKRLERFNRRKKKILDARKERKERGRAVGDLLASVGFPMLFGGGVGSVAGGAIGSIAGNALGLGFGGQIFGSAIGQAFDQASQGANQFAKEVTKASTAVGTLIESIGIRGTSAAQALNLAESLGIGEAGRAAVQGSLETIVGKQGIEKLDNLARSSTDASNAIDRFGAAASAAFAPFLAGINDFTTMILGGISPLERAERAEIERSNVPVRQRGSAVRRGRLQGEIETLRSTPEAAAQLELEKQIKKVISDRVDLAKESTTLEKNRLTMRRDVAAVEQGNLAVQAEQNKLDILGIRLSGDMSEAKRRELELEVDLTEQAKERAEAARDNARIEAERQIQREQISRAVSQIGLLKQSKDMNLQLLQIEEGRFNFVEEEFRGLKDKLAVTQMTIDLERKSALIGKTEEETIASINRGYDLKLRIAEQQLFIDARLLAQADAAYQLSRLRVEQERELQDLQAANAAQQQIEATSPFNRTTELLDPFFGVSRQLEIDQAAAYTRELQLMETQLSNVGEQLQIFALAPDVRDGLRDQEQSIKNQIANFKEYRPAIDEAALAQARFTEALALTVPVTDAVFDNLLAVVEGTKTAEEAFADFLRSIASMLIDAAKQIIATYIAIGVARMFAGVSQGKGSDLNLGAIESYSGIGANTDVSAFIPGRASGGSVSAGRPYMVGERGPELFVPGASGNIVPNHAMGGANVTVNVDASGTQAQGNQPNAKLLGQAIGAAVQAELIKQKRPGGLLAA